MPPSFSTLFERTKPVIAMIHTGPSPGVPGFIGMASAIDRAIAEAEVYVQADVDGILIENMWDFPCVHEREMGPEVAAFLTRVARAVKRRARHIPVGLHVLFQAHKTALAVALAAGCDFIRAEGWTHAHISDKGIADASAGITIRYREQIGAEHIAVFADIKKKHAAHSWTSDLSIAAIAEGMHLNRADGIIVTGHHTGRPVSLDDLKATRTVSDLPVLVGSGVTPDNVSVLSRYADGFIVGSYLKENGRWNAPVCENRVEAMVSAVARERKQGV